MPPSTADPGFLSLLPVLATLVVALSARNVLVGLFSGVFIGVLMTADVGPLRFLPRLVKDHLVPEVADSYNASVLVLLAFIGGFVKLIEWSGGGAAFASAATRFVTTPAKAQLGAWFGGIMVFFSDLGTPLIVGPVFQPLMDRLGVSRQKLAFILDSTSAPVAILIPFIGWGVFIMSVIADAFVANDLAMSEWDAFVAAIPFQVYAWLAISMVPVMTVLDFDYGPMREAQSLTPAPTAGPTGNEAGGHAIVVWLPLAVLGVMLFATLWQLGFPMQPVPGSEFRAGLSAAYFFASVTLVALLVGLGLRKLLDTFEVYVQGMSSMLPIAATLVLAWSLGGVTETLGTGEYVAKVARDGIDGAYLPALVFLLAAVISFATGSSWGTIVIMLPLAVPAALATDAALPIVIGATLSGGLFGDHSSPVSETTILSSTGAATPPLEHFTTQLPYALSNGGIALAAFLLAGLTGLQWSALVAIAVQVAMMVLLRRYLGGRA